jgi:hypothetical protein
MKRRELITSLISLMKWCYSEASKTNQTRKPCGLSSGAYLDGADWAAGEFGVYSHTSNGLIADSRWILFYQSANWNYSNMKKTKATSFMPDL